MTKQQDIDYTELIEKYKEKDPMVAEAIRGFQEKIQNQQSVIRLFRHDMRSPLSSIEGFSNPKRWSRLSETKRDKRISVIYNSAKTANERVGLLDLVDISREELRRYSENVEIAEVARTYVKGIEGFLERAKVGLQLKYNTEAGSSPRIYAHRAAMGSIIENLVGGGMNHAQEKTRIKLGIRKTEKNLEIIEENRYAGTERLRNIAGESRGIGLPSIERIVTVLGGKLELYNSPRMNAVYRECPRFGYMGKEEILANSAVFGVKITIPINELKR